MSKKSILKKLYFLTHLNFCAKIMTYSSIFQDEISRQKLIFWIWFWREDSNIWRSSSLTKTHLNFRAKISSWILAWKFKYLKIIFWRENSNEKNLLSLKLNFRTKIECLEQCVQAKGAKNDRRPKTRKKCRRSDARYNFICFATYRKIDNSEFINFLKKELF